MRSSAFFTAAFLCAGTAMASAQADIAPTGTLRAAYLGTNPAQATRSASGEVRGASFDLATELAKRIGKPLDFKPIAGPPAVIEAVKSGQADIGFVAYEATRVGTVEFSQTYMLVQQSFLVLDASPIRALANVDQAGRKVAGTRNDSITLCLKRFIKQASVLELENNPAGLVKALTEREIDALGANRQRLTTLMKDVPGSRILPDTFFNVPQNIIVPLGKSEVLAAVNAFLDEVRASGFLQGAVEKSGIVGIAPAPKSPGSQHGCPA